MTTIVWDGHTLAADRQVNSSCTPQAVQKIFIVNLPEGKHLVGLAGSFALAMEMLHWFTQGAIPDLFPPAARGEDGGCMMVITPEKKILRYEDGPFPFEFAGPRAAAGDGAPLGLLAMHLGNSAVQAIFNSQLFTVNSGLGISCACLASDDVRTIIPGPSDM